MGRVERRMYKRAKSRRMLRYVLLGGTVAVILLGLWARRMERGSIGVQPVPQPTVTPVTVAFDETMDTRQITLEEHTWYAIQTGIYSTRAAAEEKVDLYAQRGAPGYVCQDHEKWRVYIACYGAKEDAAAVRERLSANQNVETYLHSWVCPEITLRLTGMVGQLDVAEAGLTLMDSAAAVLRDKAALLDGGEISLAEAQQAVSALGESIALWRDTAQTRFAKPYPELLQLELDMTADWSARQSRLQSAQGATALSAEMKLQAMALFDRACDMRRTLMN